MVYTTSLSNRIPRFSVHKQIVRWLSSVAVLLCLFTYCAPLSAQSTFGTVLGTVKDPSGSLVPMAKVRPHERRNQLGAFHCHQDGRSYEFVSVEAGTTSSGRGTRISNHRIPDLHSGCPRHGTPRHGLEGCVASHHGECGSGVHRADGCFQRLGNQGQPGTDRSPGGDHHAFAGFHQRLLDADGAARRADRQQQQHHCRGSHAFADLAHRGRNQFRRTGHPGRTWPNCFRPSIPSKKSRSAKP